VTPQSTRRYNNPPQSFRGKPPQKSLVVKSLFEGSLPLNTMSSTGTQTNNPNQANNQRQWSSNLFKPLDMTAIPGHPRQMPPKYEKWLAKLTGTDVTSAEEHMSNFWAFFQLHPVSDDAKDLVMKIFSATLLYTSRRWYNSLLDGSVIAQFVARSDSYKMEVQTGVTGTYPTQCHLDGKVLSL
jgi:hypothetical protein